jgi:hypothetical protein
MRAFSANCAQGASAILDHTEAVLGGERGDGVEVRRQADLVNQQDCPGSRSYRVDNGGRIEVVGPGVDVGKHRAGASMVDGIRGRHARERRTDHLVAVSHAAQAQGQMQGGRARICRDSVGGADVGGDSVLERGDPGPLADPARLDDGNDRLHLLVAEPGAEKGNMVTEKIHHGAELLNREI